MAVGVGEGVGDGVELGVGEGVGLALGVGDVFGVGEGFPASTVDAVPMGRQQMQPSSRARIWRLFFDEIFTIIRVGSVGCGR